MAKILLVEDDASVRFFLKNTLEKAGHDVMEAGDGEDALPLLRAHFFDLLLTDIVMPGMDGIALARHARQIHAHIILVFLTGFAAVALNHEEGEIVDATILSKPFHLRQLVAEIAQLLQHPPRVHCRLEIEDGHEGEY